MSAADNEEEIPLTFNWGKKIGKITKVENVDDGIEFEAIIDENSLTPDERRAIFGDVSGYSMVIGDADEAAQGNNEQKGD